MSLLPWVEKYRPKSLNDMIGIKEMSKKIFDFLHNFEYKQSKSLPMKSKEKAILMIGPPGIGKTTLVHTIGNEFGYDIREMNASDSRKKSDIQKIIGESNENESLFFFLKESKSRIIFVDEVDGISGNEDKGGLMELINIIDKTQYPIILAGNYKNDKTEKLQNSVSVIEFMPPSIDDIVNQLEIILKNENIYYESNALKKIAKNSKGDFRSAINDTQMIAKWNGAIKLNAINLDSERDIMISEEDMLLNTLNALSIDEGLYYLKSNQLTYENLLLKIGDTLIRNNPSSEEMKVLIEANNLLKYIKKESDYKLLKYFFKQIASIGPYRIEKDAILRLQKPYWRKRQKQSNKTIKKIQKIFPFRTETIFEFVIPMLKFSFEKNEKSLINFLLESTLTKKEWNEISNKV